MLGADRSMGKGSRKKENVPTMRKPACVRWGKEARTKGTQGMFIQKALGTRGEESCRAVKEGRRQYLGKQCGLEGLQRVLSEELGREAWGGL